MAASLGALAKDTDKLQSRLFGATAKGKGLKGMVSSQLNNRLAKIKGWAIAGILGKELLGALIVGATLLLMTAGFLGLAKVIDPALAALAVGGGVLAVIGLAGWWAGRS